MTRPRSRAAVPRIDPASRVPGRERILESVRSAARIHRNESPAHTRRNEPVALTCRNASSTRNHRNASSAPHRRSAPDTRNSYNRPTRYQSINARYPRWSAFAFAQRWLAPFPGCTLDYRRGLAPIYLTPPDHPVLLAKHESRCDFTMNQTRPAATINYPGSRPTHSIHDTGSRPTNSIRNTGLQYRTYARTKPTPGPYRPTTEEYR